MANVPEGWSKWDPVEHIRDSEDAEALINEALECGDPDLLQEVLGIVARARGMGKIAAETGLNEKSLYRALSKRGNPRLSTINKVLKSMGLRLAVVAL